MRKTSLVLFILSAVFNTVSAVLGLILVALWGTTP